MQITRWKAAAMTVAVTIMMAGAHVGARAQTKQKSKASIAWKPSLQAALQEAKRTKKPVMIDFWATWCGPCRAMDKHTYTHPSVIRLARQFVSVKVDIEKDPDAAKKYKLETPPLVVFLKPDGTVITRLSGFRDAASMVKSMKSALTKVSSKKKA